LHIEIELRIEINLLIKTDLRIVPMAKSAVKTTA
jgi:hypothetical protein